MRNILEYPITNKERIEALKEIKNAILAEESIGDLRAYIVQECIDTIKNNNTTMQLSADELALQEIDKLKEWSNSRNSASRLQTVALLKQAGYEPGMWVEWVQDPPPLKAYKKTTDVILLVVLDALTQESIIVWHGAATRCVSQIIHAQLNSRKRLMSALERIANALSAESGDLRDMAKDAISAEKPEG